MDVKSSMALISDIMQPQDTRSRKPQMVEAYLDMFYDEKVKPEIGAEDVQKDDIIAAAAGELRKKGKDANITKIMTKSRQMFENESQEIKTAVEERRKEMVAEMEKQKVEKKRGATKSRQ